MKALAKTKTSLTAVIVALIACFAIGSICLVSSAFADNSDNTDAQTCTATAKITATFDSDGNITIPDTELKNDTDYVVTIDNVSIESDYDFVKDWTNDAVGKTIQPGESLTVIWTAKTSVPSDFNGKTEVKVGTITYSYSFEAATSLEDADVTVSDLTYNGSTQTATPKVTLNGTELKEGVDYTVSGNTGINVADYTLTIEGIGNYAGSAQASWKITPATLGVTWGDTTFTYTGQPQVPTVELSGILGSDVVTPTVTGEQTNAGGPYTAEVTIANTNYLLPQTGITTTFTIDQADLPQDKIPTNLETSAYTNQTLKDVDLPTLSEGFDGTLAWKDPSTSTGTEAGEITATAIYTPTDTNYKAVEVNVTVTVTVEVSLFWLNVADADNPEEGILKTQSQIKKDMKILHGSDEEAKAKVTTEYTHYMNGTSEVAEGKEIHLYTKWNGNDAGTGANQWVEFRIIQVGAHDDDGSAVTFMATHSLPTAKLMIPNDGTKNRVGWSGSTLRAAMNDKDGYVMTGLKDLVGADAVTPVKKMQATYNTETKKWNDKASLTDTADTFWLLSHNELTGMGEEWKNVYRPEGTQYSWFSEKVTNGNGANKAIAGMDKTRDGLVPASASSTLDFWWLRSPYILGGTQFDGVKSTGNPYSYPSGNYSVLGVVPCFAM